MGIDRVLALCAPGLFMMLVGCGNLPRDPANTLNRVRQLKHLKVGLVENAPWVVHTSGEPAGVEVQLVREFAASLGATPSWFWGGEQTRLEALERFELDLVVGGLTATTPWAKSIGLTRPYFVEPILVGIPRDGRPPLSLRGLRVAVTDGDAAAAYLPRKGAIPVRVSELQHLNVPVAAPGWRLRQLGLTLTNLELFRKEYVMAVPPGENGWLRRLQEFIGSRAGEVTELLQREEPAL